MKRHQWVKVLAILTMIALIGAGCSSKSATQNKAVAPSAPPVASPAGSPGSMTYNLKGSADVVLTSTVYDSETAASEEGKVTRKVIQTGRMELEVLDFAKASDEITALTQSAGGYIESTSSRKNNEGRVYGTLTIRVPQPKFDQFLADLSKSGKIISNDFSGKDVTEQYIDLEARLKNAKTQEERMLAILTKADKLEDLLKVEAELARIRGEVESLQGRFNYLKHNVELATLTLSIREVDSFSTKVKTPGADIWERIQRAFISSLNMIIDVAVGSVVAVMGFSPLIILLGGLFLILRRFVNVRGFRACGAQSPTPKGPSGDDGVTK